ncbi:DUF3006 domain-containing protein (plasmid) [Alkalihalophilus pseudofirmus]|uniref:DUF3006 domain-containing protein n=1 Tax=Alkalihalophilus pseudofirmus TaxID=79885 RepID=UPI00259B1E6C|nr:DUF3006 domain-containing protein [Alkalihalophilus pseudofirmus]WEG19236.1 DUF3006 domain-containing protein [Alkalihalophilus pseudofirmus]
MEKYTVDRIEDGRMAVLLKRNNEKISKDIPLNSLPEGISEGDILSIRFDDQGNIIQAKVLKQEKEAALKKANDLLEKLKNKNKKS